MDEDPPTRPRPSPRKLLVTGATGVFGRAAIIALRRRGIEVVGLSRSADGPTADGVTWVAADIRDRDAVATAMAGCDAVLHLAWVVVPLRSEEEIHDINLGGTEAVLDAMAATGCDHLVFSSSITAYGSDPDHHEPYREDETLAADDSFHYGADKRRAEQLITERCEAEGWSLTVFRAAAVIGRGVTNAVAHVFAGPAIVDIAGHDLRWQFLHPDDLGRFLAMVVTERRTGTVNVGAPDVLTQAEVADILDRRLVTVDADRMDRLVPILWKLRMVEVDPDSAAAMTAMPVVDTTRLQDEWGFRCAWSSRAALADAKSTLGSMLQLGSVNVRRPFRLPAADPDRFRDLSSGTGAGLAHGAPDDVRGSLDTPMDRGFPTWTATNLSEAFPGPLTPLSLTLALDTLRAGTDAIVHLLGLDGAAAHEARARMVGAFGHHLYVNVDVARAAVADVPGMSQADVDAQYLGKETDATDASPTLPSWRELRSVPRIVRRIVPALIGWSRETARVRAVVDELTEATDDLDHRTDVELLALLDRTRDTIARAWSAAIVGNFATGMTAGDVGTGHAGVGADEEALLPSAVALDGITRLADRVRGGGLVDAVAACADVGELRRDHPSLAADLDGLVARCGHRGPGEMELCTGVIADDPTTILRIVARAASVPARGRPAGAGGSGPPGRIARLAHRATHTRETARDAVVRAQHVVRLTVRELGSRLVAADRLDWPEDVFFLTWDELHHVPADVRAVVDTRRAEHVRLGTLAMPTHFEDSWWTGPDKRADDPAAHGDGVDAAGVCIEGIGASPGTVTGPVRVLREPHDDIEPGDVLVVRVTDAGWTTLFALASAVVTDIGGTLSHAAIVAREFGIPAVLGTETATSTLRSGQVVEVDGGAGTVTVQR